MCTVDIGVMGQVWIHPNAPEAYVDFNTKHQCRDFEVVRQMGGEETDARVCAGRLIGAS
jgi:hypothetical protein